MEPVVPAIVTSTPQAEGYDQRITLRFRPAEFAPIVVMAERSERTISQQLRHLIKLGLEAKVVNPATGASVVAGAACHRRPVRARGPGTPGDHARRRDGPGVARPARLRAPGGHGCGVTAVLTTIRAADGHVGVPARSGSPARPS